MFCKKDNSQSFPVVLIDNLKKESLSTTSIRHILIEMLFTLNQNGKS